MTLFKWMLKVPKNGHRKQCVILFKNKYFDGSLWTNDFQKAQVFDTPDHAWDFIDQKLDPGGDHEEDFCLRKI